MMDTMRKMAKGFVAKTLMLLLVLSFAVWGVGDVLRSRTATHVAQVGKSVIGQQEFMREAHKLRQISQAMGMQSLPKGMLEDETLRRIVQQRLIQHWADESGIVIARELLTAELKRDEKFLDVTGKFDPKSFQTMLENTRIPETVYLHEKEKEITNQLMVKTSTVASIHLSPAAKELAARAAAQTRDGVLITLPAPAISDTVAAALSEKELRDYYTTHAQNFLQPELRSLEYVMLDVSEIEQRVRKNVTEEALKAAQRDDASVTRDTLVEEARETILQNLAASVEDANAAGKSVTETLAILQLTGNSKILESIHAHQFDASEDTLLRQIVQNGFALEEGETSSLLSTTDGRFFLVHVKQITPPAPKSFEEVTPELRQILAQKQAQEAVTKTAIALTTALAKTKPEEVTTQWATLLAPLKLKTQRITNLQRPLDKPQGTRPQKLSPLLQKAAFEKGLGELVGPSTTEDGSQQFLLLTAAHQPKADLSAKAAEQLDKSYQHALEIMVMNAAMTDIATRHPVQINAPLLNQLVQENGQ